MWMSQITIMNRIPKSYEIHVSDGRIYVALTEEELGEKIKELAKEKP